MRTVIGCISAFFFGISPLLASPQVPRSSDYALGRNMTTPPPPFSAQVHTRVYLDASTPPSIAQAEANVPHLSHAKFSDQTTQAYEEAKNKLQNYHDNDDYALQRFNYIVNKHLSKLTHCDYNACVLFENKEVFEISSAIIKADPTQKYWRALKLCEDSVCAEQLVGELPNYPQDMNSQPNEKSSSQELDESIVQSQ